MIAMLFSSLEQMETRCRFCLNTGNASWSDRERKIIIINLMIQVILINYFKTVKHKHKHK